MYPIKYIDKVCGILQIEKVYLCLHCICAYDSRSLTLLAALLRLESSMAA